MANCGKVSTREETDGEGFTEISFVLIRLFPKKKGGICILPLGRKGEIFSGFAAS